MSNENWRVVREWSNYGEVGVLYVFRLEDVYQHPKNSFNPPPPNLHPFVKHECHGLYITGDTTARLRERLKAMLAALDEPVLEYTPRKLIELPKEGSR